MKTLVNPTLEMVKYELQDPKRGIHYFSYYCSEIYEVPHLILRFLIWFKKRSIGHTFKRSIYRQAQLKVFFESQCI